MIHGAAAKRSVRKQRDMEERKNAVEVDVPTTDPPLPVPAASQTIVHPTVSQEAEPVCVKEDCTAEAAVEPVCVEEDCTAEAAVVAAPDVSSPQSNGDTASLLSS